MPYYPPQMRQLSVAEKRGFLNVRYDKGPADSNKYYPRLSYQFTPYGGSFFGDNWGIKIPSDPNMQEYQFGGAYVSPKKKASARSRTEDLTSKSVYDLHSPRNIFGQFKDPGSTSLILGDEDYNIDILFGSANSSPSKSSPPKHSPPKAPPLPGYMQLNEATQLAMGQKGLQKTLAAGYKESPKKYPKRDSRNQEPNYGNFKRLK